MQWLRDNPNADTGITARFSALVESPFKEDLQKAKATGGLLAPVAAATDAFDRVTVLANDAFYYAKRAPFLARWHGEVSMHEFANRLEVKQLQEQTATLS